MLFYGISSYFDANFEVSLLRYFFAPRELSVCAIFYSFYSYEVTLVS